MAKTVLRSIVYIDGLNLYHGSIKGGPHKWLDLESYFRRLRQDDDLQRIYYFTTRLNGGKRIRQDVYLRAIGILPLVEIRLGRFKNKTVECRVAKCTVPGPKRFEVSEEKQTDVAIGIQMVVDAYEDKCDRFVLVSGDSDLSPALAHIKRIAPTKQIIVYIPARNKYRGAATEIRGLADDDRTLPLDLLRHCHLPASVPDGAGGFIHKPVGW